MLVCCSASILIVLCGGHRGSGYTKFTNDVNDLGLVVKVLEDQFNSFDSVCKDYELLKIQTVGDCYVCGAGCI